MTGLLVKNIIPFPSGKGNRNCNDTPGRVFDGRLTECYSSLVRLYVPGGASVNSSIARFAVIAITVVIFTTAFASTSDQTADRVLGQIGFSQNTINFGGPSALDGPTGAAVDIQGHLYMVDQGNNRVLGFASAASFLNGASADLVIGQPDFYGDRPAYPTITPSSLNQPVAAANSLIRSSQLRNRNYF
jgi:hypothetical protein